MLKFINFSYDLYIGATMLANLTIKKKLISLTVLFATSYLFIFLWQNHQLSYIDKSFKLYQNAVVQGNINILQVSRDMNYCSRLTRSIMLGDNFDKNLKKLITRIDDIKVSFKGLNNTVSYLPDNLQSELLQAINNSQNDTMAFLDDSLRRMNDLGNTERSQEIRNKAWDNYRATASPIANKARKSFKKLVNLEQSLGNDITQRAEQSVSDTKNYNLVIMFLCVIFISIIVMLLSLSILKPLEALKVQIDQYSDSDTNSSGDELATIHLAFNKMLGLIQTILQKIGSSSEQISSASKKLTGAAEGTHQNINKQQAEVNQVINAMDTLETTVDVINKYTEDAKKIITSTKDKSSLGLQTVKETINKMKQLNQDVESASSIITNLAKESDSIGSVVDVIKGIAEQTNLLALNAAIEAARAGEQGRGFAVVADEVRTLANRTQESTNTIQSMIENLQSGTTKAVHVMEANMVQSNVVVESSEETAHSIDMVIESISEVEQKNNEIKIVTEQQSVAAQSLKQIVTSIEQLASSTLNHAELNLQSAQTLNNLSLEQLDTINKFKV